MGEGDSARRRSRQGRRSTLFEEPVASILGATPGSARDPASSRSPVGEQWCSRHLCSRPVLPGACFPTRRPAAASREDEKRISEELRMRRSQCSRGLRGQWRARQCLAVLAVVLSASTSPAAGQNSIGGFVSNQLPSATNVNTPGITPTGGFAGASLATHALSWLKSLGNIGCSHHWTCVRKSAPKTLRLIARCHNRTQAGS